MKNEKKSKKTKTDVIAQFIFTKEINKSYFPVGSCYQHVWYKPIFYWLHEMAAYCYFGVDLGN